DELYHKYKLAVLRTGNHLELFFTNVWNDGSKFLKCCDRLCSLFSSNSWHCSQIDGNDWKFLGRHDPLDCLPSLATLYCICPFFGHSGCGSDIFPLRRSENFGRRLADHSAWTCSFTNCDQAVGHKRWGFFQCK